MLRACRDTQQRCSHSSPGTFITEWTDGEKLCEAFLAGGEEAYRAVSHQLARIAQHYRFDGWLINIENALSVSSPRPACILPHGAQPQAPLWVPVDGAILCPTALCSLLAGGGSGELVPLPAASDCAGARRGAGGAGDLV